MIDHIVKPRSMKNIRDIVNYIKKLYNLYDELEFPVIAFLEYIIPEIYPDYRILYVSDDELDGEEAYTDHNLKEIRIKESVYLNACNGSSRDLFTIAHEIGHLVLHDGETMIFARTSERFPAYKSAEWQANYFAAELLMGSHLIVDMSISEICDKCLVSKQAAEIQREHAREEREKGRL